MDETHGTRQTKYIMNKPIRTSHPLIKIANRALTDLPTPTNIRARWNFGSLLGTCLVIQIVTGLFLAIHYCPNIEIAFSRVAHICRDVNYGWILRTLHANGASIFFICKYNFRRPRRRGRIILKWIFKKYGWACGLQWLKTKSNDGFLWTLYRTNGFYKSRGISWPIKQLSTF
jgi:hypothetical protein